MQAPDASWRALVTRNVHEDVLFRNMISLSAAAWLTYECILTLPVEYDVIWRGKISRIKALYLFGRYMGMVLQLVNVYFVFGPLSFTPVPRHSCLSWFIYLAASAVALLFALDIVLMLHVHALYNRQNKVAVLFGLLLLMQGGLVFFCCRKTLPLVPFGPTCDVLDCPHQVTAILAGVMVTHTILFFMALAKRSLASSTSSIIHLVVRDGAWVFALIISMWVTIVPYSLFMKMSKPHLIFLWPMAFMSVTTCRLILHLQQAPRPQDTQNMTNTEIQFTSFIYMSEHASTTSLDLTDTPASPTSTTLHPREQVATTGDSPPASPAPES